MKTPSPFPGMDPYLEISGLWPDFHATFINYCREALSDLLPDHYEARIGERVNLVEVEPERIKRIGPDVSITRGGWTGQSGRISSAVATLEPVTIPLVIEEASRETYIEVLHRPERALVTVIEVLSPSNKEGDGRVLYLAKRNALLMQDVSVVELDFLLGGRRLPLAGAYPPGDLFALVSRSGNRPACDIYGWPIRNPLPAISIPLRAPDGDVILSLAEVFHTAYERGRYRRSIDYAIPPALANLSPHDLEWVQRQASQTDAV